MLAVTARDFAAATLAGSSAEVDAERATAVLTVEVDSGPAYRVGPPRIEGLQRHDAALVERFNPFKPGAPFDRALMLQFQQALQETAFFNSVVVTLDLESAIADEAPLRVQLREALLRRLSVGVGFATNTGAHIEALYRQAITFGRPYLLQSGFRVDQTGEFAYVDMIFPPQRGGARDSIGALVENSDIENLQINRWGVGAARSKLTGPRDGRNVETQLAFNFEHERRETPLDPPITLDVLSSTYTWTRRDVDDITNPRRGNLIQLQGSVGLGGLSIDDAFLRGYGSIVQYVPVGVRDALILRGQLGGVQAQSTNVVPNKFLFRTGGALTVRGYDFESLGVEQGGAIVGGRALAVASIEYVKWLERWGATGEWQPLSTPATQPPASRISTRRWATASASAGVRRQGRWPWMSPMVSASSRSACTSRWPSRSDPHAAHAPSRRRAETASPVHSEFGRDRARPGAAGADRTGRHRRVACNNQRRVARRRVLGERLHPRTDAERRRRHARRRGTDRQVRTGAHGLVGRGRLRGAGPA